MAYVKADVIKAVLEDLGVLDRAGNVNTHDSDRAGARFDGAIATLSGSGVATIDPDSIDDAYFLPLVAYVREECAPLFHQARDAGAIADAERRLRILAAPEPAFPQVAEYF